MSQKEEILASLGEGVQESFDPELKRAFDVADNEVPAELRVPANVRLDPNKFRLSGDGYFYTLQGEGKTMGLPAVFVRLHVCNLRCVWCDAWYTWNPKAREFWTESFERTPEELIAEIEKIWQPKTDKVRVIFTGGEPLLQQKKIETVMQLRPSWIYEIETNGTIMPLPYILEHSQFNCSPKLRNSQNADVARIHGEVLQALNKVDSQFKFVVMTPEDVEEVETDFVNSFGLEHEKIVLMPQGVSEVEVTTNMQRVAEIAKEKGYRLLGRLHVSIWGAKRRV